MNERYKYFIAYEIPESRSIGRCQVILSDKITDILDIERIENKLSKSNGGNVIITNFLLLEDYSE